MTIITTPTAASTPFTNMIGPIAPYVHGCPSAVLAAAAKRVIVDLCERARVWREYTAPTTLVIGTYTYTLVPSTSYGEIIAIYSGSTTVATVKHEIFYKTLPQAQALYPTWPEDSDGDAQIFTKIAVDTVSLLPVPDVAGTLTMYAALRPTDAATVWPSVMYQEHKRLLHHGVLHDLLMMTDRPWTNEKMALYHGKQWQYLLDTARIRADRGFNPADVSVDMIPMA